jgi:hypothetical protein
VHDDTSYTVIERGGNISLQIFATERLDELEASARGALHRIGGTLDGRSSKELVFTVPVSAGFPAIEAAMNGLKAEFPRADWYYGNVYDPVDGVTPLNWWKQPSRG